MIWKNKSFNESKKEVLRSVWISGGPRSDFLLGFIRECLESPGQGLFLGVVLVDEEAAGAVDADAVVGKVATQSGLVVLWQLDGAQLLHSVGELALLSVHTEAQFEGATDLGSETFRFYDHSLLLVASAVHASHFHQAICFVTSRHSVSVTRSRLHL